MTAPCVVSEGTLIDVFGTASDWSVIQNAWTSEQSYDDDSAEKPTFVASPTAGGDPGIYQRTISLDLSSLYTPAMSLLYWSYPMYPTSGGHKQYATLGISFSSTTDFSKSMSWTMPTSEYIKSGLNRIVIGSGQWTNTGSESWSNTMVRMRVTLDPAAYGYYVGVRGVELRGDYETTPYIALVFDNMMHSVMDNAFPFLDNLDIPATVQIDIPDIQTGHPYKPEIADIHTLQDAGWACMERYMPETLGTSIPHGIGFDQMSTGIHQATVDYTREWWFSHGLTSHGLGSAIGMRYNWEIERLYRNNGVRWAVQNGFMNMATPFTFDSRYQIGVRIVSINQSVTLAIAKGWVDECVDYGTSLALSFKELAVSPTGEQWGWQDFQDLVAYIQAEGVALVTLPQLCYNCDGATANTGAANSVILGSIELNDGVNYFVENEGLNLGEKQTNWDEVPSYAATPNAQVNLRRGGLVPVTLPLMVKGSSDGDLDNKLAALWVEVDKTSNTLTLGSNESYTVIYSTRPDTIERDTTYHLSYIARFTLVLMREP